MYLGVLVEEVEEDAGEVVGVVVGEAQLVGQRVEEEVAPLGVQVGASFWKMSAACWCITGCCPSFADSWSRAWAHSSCETAGAWENGKGRLAARYTLW